jgi:hypothetical protein
MGDQKANVKGAVSKEVLGEKFPVDRPLEHEHTPKVECAHKIPSWIVK